MNSYKVGRIRLICCRDGHTAIWPTTTTTTTTIAAAAATTATTTIAPHLHRIMPSGLLLITIIFQAVKLL
jgi:hypothetical protein